MNFVVKTGSFTGPLDLLLQLIEKRKLFIGDISLAAVADDFLQHLKNQSSFPVGTVAHFLVIASTLLLIKSRSLLPYLKLSEEENQDIEDLQRRLHLYKEVRTVSKKIRALFGKQILFIKSGHASLEPIFAPHKRITIETLHTASQNLIATFPLVEHIPHTTVEKVMSLEEMINSLTDRIQNSIETSFTALTKTQTGNSKHERLTVIISFLALLELVKEGVISVKQQKIFDDISILKT